MGVVWSMTDITNLIQIFFEAAHRASVFPLASEAMLYALKSFGEADLHWPVITAILGGMAGHGFNLLLGRFIMKAPSSPRHHPFFLKLQHYFNRYGFVLLVFAFASLGNILVVVAGMLGTPLRKSLPLIFAGLVYYYGRLLY